MATVKDFSELDDIAGVTKYLLVRDDEVIVSTNDSQAFFVKEAIVACGQQCDSLSDDLLSSHYIYCCVERDSGENVLIFPLGKYHLEIIKHPDTDPKKLAESIIAFLKTLN